jgi:NAD(P)H-hydrate epimerase
VNDLPRLPRRAKDAHKGSTGRVLVVAGSVGLTGAAFMAAKSALRAGAGVVVTACSEAVYPILAAKHTCVMVRPFAATARGGLSLDALEPILDLARDFDAVIVGPGLGREVPTRKLIKRLVKSLESRIVLDADGLNAFAGAPARLDKTKAELVLTPHPGELGRILGTSAAAIQKDREGAVELLGIHAPRAVLVLKGAGSIVARHTPRRMAVNETGNPGMATAGSGDVLSGIIATLLAQKMDPWEAARLGVWLHGRAGDLVAQEVGAPLMIATDILEKIPRAIAERLRAEEVA